MRKLLKIDVRSMYPFELTEDTFLNDNEHTLVVGISRRAEVAIQLIMQ